MSVQVVSIDPIRTLGALDISVSYSPIGNITTEPVRLVCVTNNCNFDCFFSVDGINDQLFVAQGSFKLFDLCTNRYNVTQYWTLPVGTQFYVRSGPTLSHPMGNIYIECLWGENPNE